MRRWAETHRIDTQAADEILAMQTELWRRIREASRSSRPALHHGKERVDRIRQCLARGLYSRIAIHTTGHMYRTLFEWVDAMIATESPLSSLEPDELHGVHEGRGKGRLVGRRYRGAQLGQEAGEVQKKAEVGGKVNEGLDAGKAGK